MNYKEIKYMKIKLEIRDNKRNIEIDTGDRTMSDACEVKLLKDAVEQVKQLLIINNTI